MLHSDVFLLKTIHVMEKYSLNRKSEPDGPTDEINEEEDNLEDSEVESSGEESDAAPEFPLQSSLSDADSSDEEDLRNTIGNIPVSWYDDEDFIGYDWEGKKIPKPPSKSEIDNLLAKMDDPDYWRTVRDRQTGRDVVLSEEDVATISNVQNQRYPEVGYNPYEPFIDFFTHEVMEHPVCDRPEHKRSFIPSKLDKQKVSRMVHAIKMGWMKPRKPKTDQDFEPQFYNLWDSEAKSSLSKSEAARLKMRIPAPKLSLPDHTESYNPPPEYLPTPEEERIWKETEEGERERNFLSQNFGSLREVPAYGAFVKERFERCMDLYLAPRRRKMKLNVDPKDLLPALPKPADLQPFPSTMALTYRGHSGLVRALAVESEVGQWLASGGDDQSVRVWELSTARCTRVIPVSDSVHHLAWIPLRSLSLLAAAVGKKIYLLNPGVGDKLIVSETNSMLRSLSSSVPSDVGKTSVLSWKVSPKESAPEIRFQLSNDRINEVKFLSWHKKGDYFVALAPNSGVLSVVICQLSKLKSQAPFANLKEPVRSALFHPTRPLFFLALDRHVRVYDLAKQQLVKKLMPNTKSISCMALHPKGDNLIVGGNDSRVSWMDLDLSVKPYKMLRYHKGAVRGVAFHAKYPLFVSGSDDGSCVVSHGQVFNDLLKNALIVPVKKLGGPTPVDGLSVLACSFHPFQPWLLSAGADSLIRLYTY